MNSTYSTNDVAHVCIKDVVNFRGAPKKIVLDIDARFTSRIWKECGVGKFSVRTQTIPLAQESRSSHKQIIYGKYP